ncbi:MAG: hypothetical protein M1820_000975 [Bogoriella megaspora]|nr:MAG: hypothetical protein M1820_000975 [Bogoriella megaspora]
MRLLETSSLTFHEFLGSDIPPYAILSHTWGDSEVLYEHLKNGTASTRAAYSKVSSCCKLAAKQGYRYIWIDTCNIDKSSSAELQEAINSMFKWYQRAAVCFVYLADVSTPAMISRDSEFARSRWFKRGWTLQELIAPPKLLFYSHEWEEIGELGRNESDLIKLEAITRIRARVLRHETPLVDISVAERMSWAARRMTTRDEDIAYCLLGIFDVNMPLLYGEGKKAFIRLQEEIMKTSDDTSIFAWEDPGFKTRSYQHGIRSLMPLDADNIRAYLNDRLTAADELFGLLASSPDNFHEDNFHEDNFHEDNFHEDNFHEDRFFTLCNQFETPAYSITNKGLQITLRLDALKSIPNLYLADTGCWDIRIEGSIRILLMRLSTRNEFARICPVLFGGPIAPLGPVWKSDAGAPVRMSVRQNIRDRLRTIPRTYEIDMYPSNFDRCRGYSLDIIASHPKLSDQFQPSLSSSCELYVGNINYASPIQLCGVLLMEMHEHDRRSDVLFMVGLDHYSSLVFKAFEPKGTSSDMLNGPDRDSYARTLVSDTFADAWRTQDFPSSSEWVLDLGSRLSLRFETTAEVSGLLFSGTIFVELCQIADFVEYFAPDDGN